MSLFYIVDGYNLTNSSVFFRNKKLQEARESLFSFLERFRPQGSLRNKLVVVFDSSKEVFSWSPQHSFEVIFTAGQTADDKIKEIAASFSHPKDIVVVTDDRALASSLRVLGAKVMSTTEFLAKARPQPQERPKIRNRTDADGRPELNIVEREKITEDMGRLWLKKK